MYFCDSKWQKELQYKYPISEQINIQNLHMLMGDFLQASFTFHRIDFTLNGLTPEKQLNSNFPKQPN